MRRLLVFFIIFFALAVFSANIVFWTAPNPLQEQFWKPLIEEWNSNHPEAQIDWKTIPAAGSSEEAILTAVAAGSAPDFCTNIFSGFAAQLAEGAKNVKDCPELSEDNARKLENYLKKFPFIREIP